MLPTAQGRAHRRPIEIRQLAFETYFCRYFRDLQLCLQAPPHRQKRYQEMAVAAAGKRTHSETATVCFCCRDLCFIVVCGEEEGKCQEAKRHQGNLPVSLIGNFLMIKIIPFHGLESTGTTPPYARACSRARCGSFNVWVWGYRRYHL
jgi:hypothetical protein